MSNFRANAGPFTEKPFFRQKDFEQICEDELKQNGLFPTEPASVRIVLHIVSIVRMVVRRFSSAQDVARRMLRDGPTVSLTLTTRVVTL